MSKTARGNPRVTPSRGTLACDPRVAFIISSHALKFTVDLIWFSLVNQVVNGQPLTSRPIHEPVSSFDSNGRYVGLENLVQMLQNTPDTPEPESPYEIYESTVSLSSEQRSPVVQQIAEDPQAIFNQVMMWTV